MSSKTRSRGNATPVGSVLSRLLGNLQSGGRPSTEEIQAIWARLAGAQAAEHSWPRTLKSGRLVVEVENSGWMHELGMKKAWLLEGLIELLGAARIKRVSFRIGEHA